MHFKVKKANKVGSGRASSREHFYLEINISVLSGISFKVHDVCNKSGVWKFTDKKNSVSSYRINVQIYGRNCEMGLSQGGLV